MTSKFVVGSVRVSFAWLYFEGARWSQSEEENHAGREGVYEVASLPQMTIAVVGDSWRSKLDADLQIELQVM